MLIKLGSVWVDPSAVRMIFLSGGDVFYRVEFVPQSISLGEGTNETVDEYSAIVNEALAPKQSWPEEVSEPQ